MIESGSLGVVGTVIDAPTRGRLRSRDDALVVSVGGEIQRVVSPGEEDYSAACRELEQRGRLRRLPPGSLLLPGLVDLHNHAPQWPQLGKALDVPLEVWLNEYTFPLERRYEDVGFAAPIYRSLVEAMLGNGTTTAVYFGTIHLAATRALVDECLDAGQRAVVGKVAMDHPEGCPDDYRDASAANAIAATAEFIEYVHHHPDNSGSLVVPAVTPRFLPSCTDSLLQGLGDLVAATGSRVQTHCSESDWVHQYGLDRYGLTDTQTYAAFGLLQRATVLAHCNFISDSDMGAIAAAGAAVAHCPLSNAYFANAVFPTRRAFERGVHVGLGTDISGGPDPSIFGSAASSVAVSRLREDGVDASIPAARRGVADSRVSFAEAFWMATAGGGLALDLPIGLIDPGFRFDAIAVAPNRPGSNLLVWADLDSTDDVVQKVIHNARRGEITDVWVDGREVKTSSREPLPRQEQ